jgi:hypothetical protein
MYTQAFQSTTKRAVLDMAILSPFPTPRTNSQRLGVLPLQSSKERTNMSTQVHVDHFAVRIASKMAQNALAWAVVKLPSQLVLGIIISHF